MAQYAQEGSLGKATQRPYKVAIWGPGGVGSACIRELSRLPDFEIVAVLGFHPAKVGRDAGELLGLPPLGITVTGDKNDILRSEADCVLHCATIPLDPDGMHADVEALLRAGKNVISSAGYHHPAFHGPELVARLEAACTAGGASLHGTGENPGFLLERVAMTLTAVCTSVEHVRVQEITDLSDCGSQPEVLAAVGFGQPLEAIDPDNPGLAIWERFYFSESLTGCCERLHGRPPDRITRTVTAHPAREATSAMGLPIATGSVGYIEQVFTAWLDDRPRLSTEIHWYAGRANAPQHYAADDHWVIEVEGKPCSLRVHVDSFASLKGDTNRHPGDPTTSITYASAAILIQAIPVVCAAPAGIVVPTLFTHCSDDFRRLAPTE